MTNKEKQVLSIMCGVLQDLSEIVKDKSDAAKIKEIQLMIEKLVTNKK